MLLILSTLLASCEDFIVVKLWTNHDEDGKPLLAWPQQIEHYVQLDPSNLAGRSQPTDELRNFRDSASQLHPSIEAPRLTGLLVWVPRGALNCLHFSYHLIWSSVGKLHIWSNGRKLLHCNKGLFMLVMDDALSEKMSMTRKWQKSIVKRSFFERPNPKMENDDWRFHHKIVSI